MHPDLDAIVAADAAARGEVEAATQRLAGREAAARERLMRSREASAAAARAQLDAEVERVQAEGRAAIDARRAARQARRDRQREQARPMTAAAVAAYVAIVRGGPSAGGTP